jgi:hypothetical protein
MSAAKDFQYIPEASRAIIRYQVAIGDTAAP